MPPDLNSYSHSHSTTPLYSPFTYPPKPPTASSFSLPFFSQNPSSKSSSYQWFSTPLAKRYFLLTCCFVLGGVLIFGFGYPTDSSNYDGDGVLNNNNHHRLSKLKPKPKHRVEPLWTFEHLPIQQHNQSNKNYDGSANDDNKLPSQQPALKTLEPGKGHIPTWYYSSRFYRSKPRSKSKGESKSKGLETIGILDLENVEGERGGLISDSDGRISWDKVEYDDEGDFTNLEEFYGEDGGIDLEDVNNQDAGFQDVSRAGYKSKAGTAGTTSNKNKGVGIDRDSEGRPTGWRTRLDSALSKVKGLVNRPKNFINNDHTEKEDGLGLGLGYDDEFSPSDIEYENMDHNILSRRPGESRYILGDVEKLGGWGSEKTFKKLEDWVGKGKHFDAAAATNAGSLYDLIDAFDDEDENEEDDEGGKHRWLETRVLSHIEGFTVMDNLYVKNGTVYLISTNSSGDIPSLLSNINIGANDPNLYPNYDPSYIQLISPKEATKILKTTRASKIEGVSWLWKDTYLPHFAHFLESFLGSWKAYSSISELDGSNWPLPFPERLHFTMVKDEYTGWRDKTGLVQLLVKAAFPSIGMSFKQDWEERASSGVLEVYERVLFEDRIAAGKSYENQASRRVLATVALLPAPPLYWEPVRQSILNSLPPTGNFTPPSLGIKSSKSKEFKKLVITYISRQEARIRRIKPNDHQGLVDALRKLEIEGMEDPKKNDGSRLEFKVNVVVFENLTLPEQINLAASTDIMVGLHGNGLAHLHWMPPGSTVIEIMFPGGWGRDFELPANMLHHMHYATHGDKVVNWEEMPWMMNFPKEWHGFEIPASANTILAIIKASRTGTRLPHLQVPPWP